MSDNAPKPAAPSAQLPTTPPSGPPAKPEPKHPGFVTCTVDGKEVVAKPGTNLIEAAKTVGAEIPYYCYHPRLSIAANCRMCLVEASNSPKLVPACQTPLGEGVAFRTNTAKVKETQRSVMEFLLLNHPVDCAICDQAGECKLQDYYMRYDFRPSRLEGGKVLKNKRKVLGPTVVLDQERCILCTRCVRVMQEVAKEPQLGVFGRGSHEVIDTFPGSELDSNYSLNTVDVCPVGALTQRDFRFKARAWFLSAVPSVCTGCSRGCNVYADFFAQDTYRLRPRENAEINQSWMCDHGRFTYQELNENRVERPTFGRGTEVLVATREEAVSAVAQKLKELSGAAILVSPLLSNEELLATLAFAKRGMHSSAIYLGGRSDGEADHFLLTGDRNPNRKGLLAIAQAEGLTVHPLEKLKEDLAAGRVKALFAFGSELPLGKEEEAAFGQSLSQLETVVVVAKNSSPLSEAATVLFPAASHLEDEGTFMQQDGILQRFRRGYPSKGEALPVWKWVSLISQALGGESYTNSREVWKALAPRVPEFASFKWDQAAPIARKKAGAGITPLPTGADGRPPGFREFNVQPEKDALHIKGETR